MAESKFREMAKRDKAMFQKELGDPTEATLMPYGEDPVEITVIVAEIDGAGRKSTDGFVIDHRKTWLIAHGDLPEPKDFMDKIIVGGKKYTLDNHRMEGSFWRAEWTFTESTKRVGAETYRDK